MRRGIDLWARAGVSMRLRRCCWPRWVKTMLAVCAFTVIPWS